MNNVTDVDRAVSERFNEVLVTLKLEVRLSPYHFTLDTFLNAIRRLGSETLEAGTILSLHRSSRGFRIYVSWGMVPARFQFFPRLESNLFQISDLTQIFYNYTDSMLMIFRSRRRLNIAVSYSHAISLLSHSSETLCERL